MRSWAFPVMAVAVAMAAAYVHVTLPVASSEAANPMLWASDVWTTWEMQSPADAKAKWRGGELPSSPWFRTFRNGDGLEVWHSESPWPALPQGWSERRWRGGHLCGTPASLQAWEEAPATMAAHWKEADEGAFLTKTRCGWALRSHGWVTWTDPQSPCGRASEEDVVPSLLSPTGANSPAAWWSSRDGEAPLLASEAEEQLRSAGVPLSAWGTRWSEGGRWNVEGGEAWREDVADLASRLGWTVQWEGDEVIVNGQSSWSWTPLSEPRMASSQGETWTGKKGQEGAVLWSRSADADPPTAALVAQGTPTVTPSMGADMGTLRNHRTSTRMTVRLDGQTLVAEQSNGEAVWSMTLDGAPLWGGVEEVDVYANGKYQAMFAETSGLHLVDVKGREVSGFPVRPTKGEWTAWTLVDYDGTRKYRYLVASDKSGLVENFRKEGERTPGWTHRPADGVDVASPVRHLQHLRLGSKDYIYVGRDNGQVELLKRNGTTRATTPVKVHASHPPVFREGGNLDRTSVLFVDALGWVREFTLGQGEEVGLSGATRGDRLERLDVDGDGRDEIVTWWGGTRSVWNARNEKVE